MDKTTQRFAPKLREVRDFPKPGVVFQDVSPILEDALVRKEAMAALAKKVQKRAPQVTAVAALDARGFLIGAELADLLGARLVMVRKPGKLPPSDVIEQSYQLEYGEATLQVRRDAFFANESVLLVDDVLATGGTAAAAMQLVRRCGARAVALAVIVDLNILCAAHPLQLNEVTIVSLVNSRFVPTNGMVRYRPAANTVMSWQELDDRGVVFAHPSMRAFAKHFLRHSPATQAMYRLGRVEWASFPDGWPNITFEPLEHLRNRHVLFFGSLDDPRTVFEQMAFIKVLPRQQIKSLDVVFPYYGPGTMERVDREGVVATAEPLAKMLSELPTCGGSIARLHIYDIHALQERFYFPDTVSVRLHTAVDVLKRHIGMQPVTIVFPDDGAAKRFKQHFEQYPIIVCSKVREGDRRVVRIVDRYNCPDGYDAFQHVLIVDDLCHSGGTLHECRLALVEAGAQRVDAFVTHALFDNNSHVQFFKDNARAGFTRFYVTDTVPRVANKLRNQAPFEVLSIMGSLMKRMPSVERNQDIAIPLHRHSATAAHVIVASTSPHKLHAAYCVMQRTVLGVASESGVAEQPVGLDETTRGARNRMRSVLERFPVAVELGAYVMGIESGLKAERYVEYTVVVDNSYDRYVHTQSLPKAYASNAKQDGAVGATAVVVPSTTYTTYGKMLAARLGVPHDAWHERVLGIPRDKLIISALFSGTKDVIGSG